METKSVENSDSSLPKTRTGKQCAVKDCSNCFYDSQGNPTGLHFFKFPSVPLHRRTRWCNLIGRQHKRDGFEVTKSTVVCEKHFKKDDIKIAFGSRRWNLCEGLYFSVSLPLCDLFIFRAPYNFDLIYFVLRLVCLNLKCLNKHII